jgi:hypothetical protein
MGCLAPLGRAASRRAVLIVLVSLTGAVLAGCGSNRPESSVVLSVRIMSGVAPDGEILRYALRCGPTGGDMPNRTVLCRMIAAHPQAMLYPGQTLSVCDGGAGTPQVSVSGVWHGRSIHNDPGVPMCDWPGGVSALAYWAAAETPHYLPLAALRLRCDEDTSLQKRPIPWGRVRACLSALPPHWHNGPPHK